MLHQSLVPFPFLNQSPAPAPLRTLISIHSYGPRAPANLEKHKTPHETTALKSDAFDLSHGAGCRGKGEGHYSKEFCNEENKSKPKEKKKKNLKNKVTPTREGELPVSRNPTSQNRPRQLSCLSASLQLQSQDIQAGSDLLEGIPGLAGELKSCLSTLPPPHIQSSSQCSPVGFPVGSESQRLGRGMKVPSAPIKGKKSSCHHLDGVSPNCPPKSFKRMN